MSRTSLRFAERRSEYLLLALLVLCWEVVTRWFAPGHLAAVVPPPSSAVGAGVELLLKGKLLWHLADSLRRVLSGWAMASLLGIVLGLSMAWWPRLERQIEPLIEVLRPIPPIAWIPLSILWLGTGERQMIFIAGIGAFFAALLNTVHGARGVDRGYIRAARCLGATPRAILRKVIVRGAMPEILTGLRIGLGFSWMSLVAAELVAATSGLTFLSLQARYALRIDRVILTMALIGFLGTVTDRLLRWVGRTALPWVESGS